MMGKKEEFKRSILRTREDIAVDVRSVSKKYRIYHEKVPSLKIL